MIIYHQKVNYGKASILRTFGPQPKPKGDRMTAATKCNLASLVKMLSTNSCSGRSDMCFFIKTKYCLYVFCNTGSRIKR